MDNGKCKHVFHRMYFITEGFVFENGAFGFKNEGGGYRIYGINIFYK